MKLIIARSAVDDLAGLRDYYREQGASIIGEQLVKTILEKVERLIDHPDSGRQVPEFTQAQIREIIYPPFRIVYLRHPTTINLVRVWRSERLLELPENET